MKFPEITNSVLFNLAAIQILLNCMKCLQFVDNYISVKFSLSNIHLKIGGEKYCMCNVYGEKGEW